MGTGWVSATALSAAVAAIAAEHVDRSALLGCLLSGVITALAVAWFHARSGRRSHSHAVRALLGAASLVVVFAGVGLRAHQDLRGLGVDLPERISTTAELGSDPETMRFGTAFEVVADGRRFTATLPRTLEGTVTRLRTGDRIQVEGRVGRLDRAPLGWVRSRHLAGRLEVTAVAALPDTQMWFRAANAVHELLERGAGSMDQSHRALYLGLVVGDDRNQSELTQFHFRASGLTHLLAVSGQNLVFVLAVLAPVTKRLTYRTRWVLGVGAVVAFVVVTRAEPSVLRAATMTVLGLSATAAGRRVPAVRLVGLAVMMLLVADPMLVHSVGFRLSVAATLGLVLLSAPMERRLVGPEPVRLALAVTLAAQAGALPVMVATFGNVSLVAVPANLLAGPAAGLVMTLGLSTGLLSGLLREDVARLLQAPVRIGVWWVDRVAVIGAEPAIPPRGVLVWAVIVGAFLCAAHLWRTRGATAIGRVTAVAVIPMVVWLRPPVPTPGEVISHAGGGELRGTCAGWVLHIEGAGNDEHTGVELLESLWQMGVTRVAAVSAPRRGVVSEMVARELRAPLSGGPREPTCGRTI